MIPDNSYFDWQYLVGVYIGLLKFALPINIVFGIGNILCGMFISAVTKGKLTLGDD